MKWPATNTGGESQDEESSEAEVMTVEGTVHFAGGDESEVCAPTGWDPETLIQVYGRNSSLSLIKVDEDHEEWVSGP